MNSGVENPYAVLGVQTDASDAEIRRAYLTRVKSSPPDHDPEGFRRAREAYEALRTGADRVTQSILGGPHLPDVSSILNEMASEPLKVSADLVRAQVLAVMIEVVLGSKGKPAEDFQPVPERLGTPVGGM